MLEERAEAAEAEAANLRARLATFEGRVEALERAVARQHEREMHVRRAVGQFAAAYDVRK